MTSQIHTSSRWHLISWRYLLNPVVTYLSRPLSWVQFFQATRSFRELKRFELPKRVFEYSKFLSSRYSHISGTNEVCQKCIHLLSNSVASSVQERRAHAARSGADKHRAAGHDRANRISKRSLMRTNCPPGCCRCSMRCVHAAKGVAARSVPRGDVIWLVNGEQRVLSVLLFFFLLPSMRMYYRWYCSSRAYGAIFGGLRGVLRETWLEYFCVVIFWKIWRSGFMLLRFMNVVHIWNENLRKSGKLLIFYEKMWKFMDFDNNA